MRKGITTGLAILALALPASAQQAEPEALQITATNVTAVQAGRDGDTGLVQPGDVLEYTLVFTNPTDGPVNDLVFNDPIPEGLIYRLGTATSDRNDVVVDYSIDDGQSWSATPEVEVQEGGQTVRRPAPANSYTHIRWTVQGSIAAGATVTARFQAQAAATSGEES